MSTKMVRGVAIMLALSLPIVGMASDAAAGSVVGWNLRSIHCTLDVGSGGKAVDDFFACAVKIKEVAGFCKNPQGKSTTAKGKPYDISALAIASTATNSFLKVNNGSVDDQDIAITNQMIQEAFDIYQSEQATPEYKFLKASSEACPNGNWKFWGYFPTKADAQFVWAKVPSDESYNPPHSGTASFVYPTDIQCPVDTNDPTPVPAATEHCQCVKVPKWNWTWNADGEDGVAGKGKIWDGKTYNYVPSCALRGEPFKFCSRFTEANPHPDAGVADSGLRLYDTAEGWYTGTPNKELSIYDSKYLIRECYLWRDVNKNPAFDLDAFGTYNPYEGGIAAPQTGDDPPGSEYAGLVITEVSTDPTVTNWYTGECHQHGVENNKNADPKTGIPAPDDYVFQQKGPQMMQTDPSTGAWMANTGDPACQGASQLMDMVYGDGILP